MDNELVKALEQTLIPDNGIQEQILNFFQSLEESPEAMIHFLIIAQQHQNPIVKQQAAIRVFRSYPICANHLDSQNQEKFEQVLIQLLSSIPFSPLYKTLAEVAFLHLDRPAQNPWMAFIQYSISILQQQNNINQALYIWGGIISISSGAQIAFEHFANLVQVVMFGFQSSESETRISSLNLLELLVEQFNSEEVAWPDDLSTSLLTITQNAYQFSATNNEPSECIKISSALSSLLQNEFPPALDISKPVIKLALDVLSSDTNPSTRLATFSLVQLSPFLEPDEPFQPILSTITTFVQSLFTPENIFYLDEALSNVEAYITSVCENTEQSPILADECFQMFSSFVTSKNASGLIVSLTAIRGLIEPNPELVDLHRRDFIAAIHLALSSTDQYLYDIGCTVLCEAADHAPYLYSQSIDSITSLLIPHLDHPPASSAFSRAVYEGHHELTNSAEIIAGLLRNAQENESMREILVSCTGSVISCIKSISSELFNGTMSALQSLISPSDFSTSALSLEVIGSLSSAAPHLMIPELPAIIDLLCQCASAESPQLDEYICLCSSSLFSNLPLSMIPLLPKLMPVLLTLLHRYAAILKENPHETEEFIDEDGDNDEESDGTPDERAQIHAFKAAMNALSIAISELPRETSEVINDVISTILNFLNFGRDVVDQSAAKSLFIMNEILPSMPTFLEITKEVITKIQKSTRKSSVANEALIALAGIFMSGTSLTDEFYNQIIQAFSDFINPDNLKDNVMYGLFLAMRSLALYSPPSQMPNLCKKIACILQPLLQVDNPMAISYTVHTLCIMTFSLSSIDPGLSAEIANSAYEAGLEIIGSKEFPDSVKMIAFAGFNYLAWGRPEIFNPEHVPLISAIASNYFNSDESDDNTKEITSVFWLSMAAQDRFMMKKEIKNAKNALKNLPPPIDDDDIPIATRATVILAQKFSSIIPHEIAFNIGVNVLSSGDWCLKLIPNEIVEWVVQEVNKESNDSIASKVNGNEHNFRKILGRLHKQ